MVQREDESGFRAKAGRLSARRFSTAELDPHFSDFFQSELLDQSHTRSFVRASGYYHFQHRIYIVSTSYFGRLKVILIQVSDSVLCTSVHGSWVMLFLSRKICLS
jgi:hypothetical protein